MSNIEQTLSIIKPDAVERNLENEIKEMFKNNGFSILKEKKIQIEKSEAENFYKVHDTKPFYNDLCEYLSSGPIVVMVLEKENAVLGNRELMGATNPAEADADTIRAKYGTDISMNATHGSDSNENAEIEGVTIIGDMNMIGGLAPDASNLYSRNLHSFLSLFIDLNSDQVLNWEDEIVEAVNIIKDSKISESFVK